MGGSHKAVVVVPLYKETLSDLERKSFLHNMDVLSGQDVTAIYPRNMDLSFYRSIAPQLHYVAFGQHDFASVMRYNRLLISPRFYEAFASYEYMLICHFDAWVFKDALQEWCDKGFDYVGPPFLEPFIGKTTAILPFLSTICINRIGNGGLCLRKISTHIRVTRWLRPLSWFYFYNEDVFFSLVVPLFFRTYRFPSVEEAIRFGVEEQPQSCFEKLAGELPFGCHGWFKRDQNFWAKYIS